jgi:hypothetical protein
VVYHRPFFAPLGLSLHRSPPAIDPFLFPDCPHLPTERGPLATVSCCTYRKSRRHGRGVSSCGRSAAAALEAAHSGRASPLAFPVLLVPNPTRATTSITTNHWRAHNPALPRHTTSATQPSPQRSIPRTTAPTGLLKLRTWLATRSLASTRANARYTRYQAPPVLFPAFRRVLAIDPAIFLL